MLTMTLALLASVALAKPTAFEVTNNKTFVSVVVNGSAPQWFIFDTGNNGGSLLSQECADRLHLARGAEQQAQIGAGSGAPVGLSQASQALHLEVLGETLSVAEPTVMTLAGVSSIEGRRVDGLIGADFLARYVVQIDYAKSEMTARDPSGYEPPPDAVVLPLDLDAGWPIVEGTVTPRGGAPIRSRWIVDTGMRGTLTLFRPLSERHRLHEMASLHHFVLGGGAGGMTRGDIGRVESIGLGSLVLREPVVSFARDTIGIFNLAEPAEGIMGGEILRRNRVTFDCPHRRLILEPYAGEQEAFEADMSGLFLVSDPPDYKAIRVAWVNAGTPAEEAGLRKDDEIVAIDGRSTPQLSLDDARTLLRIPTARRLRIRRGGRVLDLRLTLRRMV